MILEIREVLDSLYDDVIIPNWETIQRIYVGDWNTETRSYDAISSDKAEELKQEYENMDYYEWEVTEVESTDDSILLSIRDSELCVAMTIEYSQNQEPVSFSCILLINNGSSLLILT